jgi:23S rRNA pseudouridine1911/1915/1917 synthase
MEVPGRMKERHFVADRGDDRRRLDLVLVRRLADIDDLSRSQIARWIRDGRVRVDGDPIRRSAQRLLKGQAITVLVPPLPSDPPPVIPQPVPLDVVWEDAHMLVLNKAAGVVVHPTWGHRYGTVMNGLKWRARRGSQPEMHPRLAHRLDKNTSGLLMVAKTDQALAGLARALQRREVEKEYLAVAHGRPDAGCGRISLPLGRDPEDPKRRRVLMDGGRPSETTWRLVASAPGGRGPSLIRCRPRTGRTHQIRVHLAAIGHPLIGDHLYALVPDGGVDELVIGGFARQALHAWRLRLRHPVSDGVLELEAPPPPDLCELLAACGLDLPLEDRPMMPGPASVEAS